MPPISAGYHALQKARGARGPAQLMYATGLPIPRFRQSRHWSSMMLPVSREHFLLVPRPGGGQIAEVRRARMTSGQRQALGIISLEMYGRCKDALEGIGWREPAVLLGPAGGVSGGLEAARSKGVLGFNGIKMHRVAGGLVLFHTSHVMQYPMQF